MNDDDVSDEVLEDDAAIVLDGDDNAALPEAKDNDIEEDDVTPVDIDDGEPAEDDAPSVDALGYFFRQLNRPQNSLLPPDAFNALARRFAAEKFAVSRLIEEIVCCRVFNTGHDPSTCSACSRYDAFAKEFGAPDSLARLSAWTDELVHSHKLFLPRLFRFFDRREAERILSDMCRANFRLVLSIAKRSYWRWKGIPLVELVQEGNQGLMLAVIRFDPELGFRFSTFASWRIRQYVNRAPHDYGRSIRIPPHVSEFYGRLRNTVAKRGLDLKTAGDDDLFAIAKEMEATPHSVVIAVAAMTNCQDVMSLDQQIGAFEDGGTLLDKIPDRTIAPPDALLEEKESGGIFKEAVLRSLNEKERFVIESFFGLSGAKESTLKDIAALLRISSERVRQIKTKALRKLREALGRDRHGL
jgi:RNA polymerase sigma factor (sigma-70 family)